MTASISSLLIYWGTYRCDIRVDNTDGRYYYKFISVPEEYATDENIEKWKQEAMVEASTYWETL